jgi:drug/metabolite transporter (DMT)-like permease
MGHLTATGSRGAHHYLWRANLAPGQQKQPFRTFAKGKGETMTQPDMPRVIGARHVGLSARDPAALACRDVRMNQIGQQHAPRRPARWAIVLAFALVYLSWGTTYLAIKKGVEAFPPSLFGGVRVALAGLVLLAYLGIRKHSLRVSRHDLFYTAVVGVLMFVGGNGLLTFAAKSVASGVASVLAGISPFWMVLLELLRPRGDRLTARGWLSLCAGLGGVVLLMAPKLQHAADFWGDTGPFLILGSAFSWACGSFVLRRRKLKMAHLTSAGYQMAIGGFAMSLIGLFLGEGRQLAQAEFTPLAVYSFFHLLVVGSLIGFVAYTWLLGHVSAAMAGTYAYVNPMMAILAGWLLNAEPITFWIITGMTVIHFGVALVRGGTIRPGAEACITPPPNVD